MILIRRVDEGYSLIPYNSRSCSFSRPAVIFVEQTEGQPRREEGTPKGGPSLQSFQKGLCDLGGRPSLNTRYEIG